MRSSCTRSMWMSIGAAVLMLLLLLLLPPAAPPPAMARDSTRFICGTTTSRRLQHCADRARCLAVMLFSFTVVIAPAPSTSWHTFELYSLTRSTMLSTILGPTMVRCDMQAP